MNYQEIRVNNKLIIAMDFDGTLTQNAIIDGVLTPRPEIIDFTKKMYNEGNCIIIWTCRYLEEDIKSMKKFLKRNDVRYHYINENVEGLPFHTSNKIFYDVLYDDRAGNVHDLFKILTQLDFNEDANKLKKVLSE